MFSTSLSSVDQRTGASSGGTKWIPPRAQHGRQIIVAIVDQIGQSLSKHTAAAGLFVDFRTAFNQL